LQLRADEADRHDPVLLGRAQEPAARHVARLFAFERDLAEARERIPDVRRIMDRQTPAAIRIDVREAAVGKLRTLLGGERWHAQMISGLAHGLGLLGIHPHLPATGRRLAV
jgi:hypothetical protein